MVLYGGVLLIEDDGGIRELLAQALQSEGYTVAAVSNGAEALTLLNAWTPEVIVTDLAMPVMDGLQFLEAYQGVAERAPVIALSAMTGRRQQALAAGAAAFVAKPFDLDALLALIARYAPVPRPVPAA